MGKILPFNKNAEIFRWGPIPGRYFYAAGDVFESFFIKKYKGFAWPDSFYLFRNGKTVWLTEFPKMWGRGREIFIKQILDRDKRKEIWLDWVKRVRELSDFEKMIEKISLEELSNKELILLADGFYKKLVSYWGPTLLPELGNYGAEKYLAEKISELITDKNEILKIMEVITAPEDLSFYQLEEIDLFKTNNIKAHQRKYFWLKNSHSGAEILPLKFFSERKKKQSKNLASDLKNNLAFNKNQKIVIKKKFNLTDEILGIAQAMSKGIVWQDRRKMNTFISLHYKDLFRQEVAARMGILPEDLLNVDFSELIDILKGKDFFKKLKERKNGVGIFGQNGETIFLSTKEVKKYWNLYAEEKIKLVKTDVISGIVASVGNKIVRGKVRILLEPTNPIKKGEILVTTLTSPEYIFAMRKSRAIITDSGGLGSHAAIVSRELRIPCIVGTKIATKVLKDGDLVEVDATRGIVRKLAK